MTRAFCVCVPARNEAERLPILLEALATQTIAGPVAVVVCVNNSDDESAAVAHTTAAQLGARLRVTVANLHFPPERAHAGSARRAAMDLGADLLGDDEAILISTDADCRPPEQWLAATLAACDGPLRIVGGRILLDDAEPIEPAIRAVRAQFDHYWQQVRAIEDRLDPVTDDPAPRHGDHTGASLALSRGLYRRCGGVPLLASGEDRALVAAAIAAGGRLTHPDAVWTRASARSVGRADGGMASDMRRWAALDRKRDAPWVPSFAQWEVRVRWRRAIRVRDGDAAVVRAETALPAMPCDMALVDVMA